MSKRKKRIRGVRGLGEITQTGEQTWRIRYNGKDGKRHSRGGLSYPQAQDAQVRLAQHLDPFPNDAPLAPSGAATTFADLVPAWRETRTSQPSHRDDVYRWDVHLAPTLNVLTPADVGTPLLAKLVAGLKAQQRPGKKTKHKALSGSTKSRVLALLSAFYKYAMGHGLAASNPVTTYKATLNRGQRAAFKTQRDPKDTPLIHDKTDVARIYQALPKPVNIVYAISALAGLRPGEVRALEWSDVNLERREITVRRQIRLGHVGKPKSGKLRTVPMVPSLVSALKAWKSSCPAGKLVVSGPVSWRNSEPTTSNPEALPYLNESTVNKALALALEELELPSLTLYEAGRHTFASQWVLSGQDLYRLKDIMGHSSIQVTERYAHLGKHTPDNVLAAADIALG